MPLTVEQVRLNIIKFIQTRVFPILFAAAVLLFVWGVVKYIKATSDAEVADARRAIIWGLIGLLIMMGVNGIIAIIKSYF